MSLLSDILKPKVQTAHNREERRQYWRKNHNKENLGTWDEFNAGFIKQKPYVK